MLINLDSGNDIVKTSGFINTKATIDGGSDFDTLEYEQQFYISNTSKSVRLEI